MGENRMNGFIKFNFFKKLILKFKCKFLKIFFRREDPMKLKTYNLILYKYSLFFGEKLINSSRDNSIISIKDHIGLDVCDLDVELNFHICVAIYMKLSVRLVLFT